MNRPRKDTKIRAKFSIPVPIYGAKIWVVIVGRSVSDGIKVLPRCLRVDDNDSGCKGCYIANYPNYGVVILETSHDTIAHEIGHVARSIMSEIGFELIKCPDGYPNDEPLAYLEGFLSSEMAKALKKEKITYLTG